LAATLPDQLDVLVAVLGSERTAAEFIGVSHSQFGAWRRGASPSMRSLSRIADGVAVINRLRAFGHGDVEVRSELYSLWSNLHERPAVLVAGGDAKAVLAAISARFGDSAVAKPVDSLVDLVATLRALAAAAAESADALTKAAT
jgi:hypothetical protein